jgi:dihydrofolate synthase/folylpolyglutamate synthase
LDYEEALNWIMSYWKSGRPKAQEKALRALKVPRMRALLERIGSPHLKYPSILVAGTKGKGSTAAFIAEGLMSAGYRVGRYTQPHLTDWRERTWVDGRIIEPRQVVKLVERIKAPVEDLNRAMGELGGLTTYEIGTALTLAYFADRQVEVAVLEIGVGGRLDALNAVEPVLSLVTSISLDHTDVLGDTLAEIAREKAGVFRQGRAAVTAPQHPDAEEALRQAAMEAGTHLYIVGKDWRWRESPKQRDGSIDIDGLEGAITGVRLPLLGDHQRDNATVATVALQLLRREGFQKIDEEAIRRGLESVEWPGRIQLIRRDPFVVVDAAHNEDSARRLLQTVQAHFPYERLTLVFGASEDKDLAGMARVLGPAAHRVVVTASGHRRAADVGKLESEFARYCKVGVELNPQEALQWALREAEPKDLILVTGSVFLVGRAIQILSATS